MQQHLLENLFTYKKTAALIAAFKLGLFQKIKTHGTLNSEICRQLGWNASYIELLCIYMEKEGYLIKEDNGWRMSEEFEKQFDAFEIICEHESALYYKWLSPEMICSSVNASINDRLFDKEGFAPEEQAAYDNTMYGKNINLICLHLQRKMKNRKTLSFRCMEYGRSNGRVGQVLKKHIHEMSVDIISLNQTIQSRFPYDLILLYNTVHYIPPEELQSIFIKLRKILEKDGTVCIIDVFFQEDHVFGSTVLLDWLTHGGVYNIYGQQVVEQLQMAGFEKIEQKSIDSISTEILFAYK